MIEFCRMPTISDKLKALGVKVGAADLPAPPPQVTPPSSLDEVLHGKMHSTSQGETYLVEQYLPTGQLYGQAGDGKEHRSGVRAG